MNPSKAWERAWALWSVPRALRGLVSAAALGGLAAATAAPRAVPPPRLGARPAPFVFPGPGPAPGSGVYGPVVPRPWVGRVETDPFIVPAPEGIDPGMIVAAPEGIDDGMIVPRGRRGPAFVRPWPVPPRPGPYAPVPIPVPRGLPFGPVPPR